MATVYLAQDLRHDRKVALKVLRPELAAVIGAERFLQEIKTTANLQHPHILALFDSGQLTTTAAETGDTTRTVFYVMPFVEGESLRDRLTREKQLPVDTVVRLATQVASALDYAHRHSVIHRDIKPENILIHDNTALVADFGIALAASSAGGARMSETGMSLGTPHYMSPEQAMGERSLDARTDIYALGCVCYEMLVGEPPFTGPTAQAIVAKVMTDEPRPITQLRKTVPAHVEDAVLIALAKLPADRFASAAEFAGALAGGASMATGARTRGREGAKQSRVSASPGLRVLMVALVVAVTAALWGWLRPRPEVPKPVSRYTLVLPADARLGSTPGARFTLSPDGSTLVYAGPGEPNPHLWLRTRDRLQAVPIPGTDFGFEPFLSPDGNKLAFFDRLPPRLRVVGLGGGSAITIADSGIGASGAWGPDGFLYANGPRTGGGIVRFPAGGGKPERVTTPDTAKGELQHLYPDVLPNGRGVLFTARRGREAESDIAVVDLTTGVHRVLVRGVRARYAASGHLVYVTTDGALLAAPFDPDRLSLGGSPVTLADRLRAGRGAAEFALAADGTLAYFTGPASGVAEGNRLVWRGRDGVVSEVDSSWSVDFSANALSPDGARLAVGVRDPDGRLQVWIKQMDRGPHGRLTFEGTSNFAPFWTPDGRAVVFVSGRAGGISDLYLQRADGGAEATLLLHAARPIAQAIWSPDGKWLVFQATGSPSSDIYAIRPGVDSVPVALVATPASEGDPALSPDGRWLAYGSDETGQVEVYVRPFPNAGSARWPVSTGGGRQPRWAHSGRELFFLDSKNQLVAAEVRTGATFAVGRQRELFSMEGFGRWSPAPGDQRFLMVRYRNLDVQGDLIVVENFFEELKAKVKARE